MKQLDQFLWESSLRSAENLRKMMDNLLSRYPEGSQPHKEIEKILKGKKE